MSSCGLECPVHTDHLLDADYLIFSSQDPALPGGEVQVRGDRVVLTFLRDDRLYEVTYRVVEGPITR